MRKNNCGTFRLSKRYTKVVATFFLLRGDSIVLYIFYCSVVVVVGEVNSAVANLAPTLVIFTLQLWPTLPPFTKMTNPCTLAIPSPCLLVSVICTSYSLPVSTGFGPKLPPKRLPPPNLLSPYDIS